MVWEPWVAFGVAVAVPVVEGPGGRRVVRGCEDIFLEGCCVSGSISLCKGLVSGWVVRVSLCCPVQVP